MQTRHRLKPSLPLHRLAHAAAITTTLLALLALCACKPASDTSARGGRSGQGGAIPVQAATATRQTIPISLAGIIGYVQPLRTVSVRSQVDGTIEKIHFREGQEVRAGDLLITIDRRPFENALRIARAALDDARAQDDSAQTDLARYEKLYHAALIAKEDYDQYRTKAETARAQLASAQAAVANAELQLGYTEIRAPITGRTGQFGLHEGSLVKANDAGSTLLIINQITPVSVAFSIKEEDLAKVRATLHGPPNAPAPVASAASASAAPPAPAAPLASVALSSSVASAASATAAPAALLAPAPAATASSFAATATDAAAADDSVPDLRVTVTPYYTSGSTAEGHLDFIDNSVDSTTGKTVLKAIFPNADHALWPGEFVNVIMELGHEPAILVPAAAVQPGQNNTQLAYIIAPDKTVQIRTVKTGRVENGLTVILEGVNENETVVIDGHIRLTAGAKVTITNLDKFIK